MIKFTYLVKRRSDLSQAAFEERWQGPHSAAVEAAAAALKLEAYSRCKRLTTPLEACLAASRGGAEPAFDGVIELWWPSLEVYQDMIGTPEGRAAMRAVIDTERRFVDLERSQAFFTEVEATAVAAVRPSLGVSHP